MKRTSTFGLFFLLSGVAACAPGGAPGDDSNPAAPAPGGDEGAQSTEPLASGSLQSETIAADVQKHAEALARTGDHPALLPALAGFEQRRADHGLTADDTLRIRRVVTDENGDKHARLDHFYKGLKVLGSTGVLRADRDGAVQAEESAGLRRGIAIDTTPRLTEKEALAVASARPERTGDVLMEPRLELAIRPVKKRFVKATGELVTGKEEDLNALDVERRVVDYQLVYQIDTLDKGRHAPQASHRFLVDAHTGDVLEARSLLDEVQGSGWTYKTNGPNNDNHVPLFTYQHNATKFEPRDAYRNFGVWDDDYGSVSGPNWDMNNLWGDGQAFQGDLAASPQNRQTAIADSMYAMQGTWDMFDRVWNRRGYDNDFYAGHAFVHVGFEEDGAWYNSLTGNISVGDSSGTLSSRRTGWNTLAHEFAHGVDNFTADIWGSGEPDGISEASADILSEVSEMYEIGLGLQNGSITIPAATSALDWTMPNSGRNFKTGSGYPYWYSGLEDLADEHKRALPMDHAFYFLSQGASNNPASSLFSPYLRWSMPGIGIDHAARIWVRALLTGFNGDQDYVDARASCLTAASQLYGSSSAEYKAVQNAFAAINVGSPQAGYPGAAVATYETESNNSVVVADPIANGVLPAGAPLTGTVEKRTMLYGGVSSGDTMDWYSILVPSGKTLRATMFPANDANITIFDGWDTAMDTSANTGTSMEQVQTTAPADGASRPYTIRVIHASTAFGQLPFYEIYVDLY